MYRLDYALVFGAVLLSKYVIYVQYVLQIKKIKRVFYCLNGKNQHIQNYSEISPV